MDSIVLRQAIQQKFWFDLRAKGNPTESSKATCHKSKGSQIDHFCVTVAH